MGALIPPGPWLNVIVFCVPFGVAAFAFRHSLRCSREEILRKRLEGWSVHAMRIRSGGQQRAVPEMRGEDRGKTLRLKPRYV